MARHNITVDLLDGTVKWNGATVPITNYFVMEDCEFDADAKLDLTCVSCVVAGPLPNGKWLSTIVSDEERRAAAKLH